MEGSSWGFNGARCGVIGGDWWRQVWGGPYRDIEGESSISPLGHAPGYEH